VTDLGATPLKNIGEPIRVYSLEVGQPAEAKPAPSALTTVMPESGASTSRANGGVVASLGGKAVCHLREFWICDSEVVDRFQADVTLHEIWV
jgi:hypothetical protein